MHNPSRYFVKPDDPILTKVADPIRPENIDTDEIQQTVDSLLRIAHGEQPPDASRPILVGLAAPQVGISKRIILVDVGADGKGRVSRLNVYINPEILWQSSQTEEWYEGCFSTDRVCGIVQRPKRIRIAAFTRTSNRITEQHEGYIARIFQHEIDHLNGMEFVSHIVDDTKLHWVEDHEFAGYRNNQAWRQWKTLCPREKWYTIKGIRPTG